jgi:hypothetical protein
LTDGGTEQVGGFAWLCGAEIAQLKFTVPVKLKLVTEKLPLALVPGTNMMGLLVNEKTGCGTRMVASFGLDAEGALLASPG